MNSRFKIQVKTEENIRWADADKVFAHLMEQYIKKIPPGEKPAPYKEKVENFFEVIDEEWLSSLQKAYLNVDIDSELNKAKMWLLSNTPKKNLKKFVNNWMAKAMGQKKTTPKSFKLDAMGKYYIAYCEKCLISDFYEKPQYGESRCCNAVLLDKKPQTGENK